MHARDPAIDANDFQGDEDQGIWADQQAEGRVLAAPQFLQHRHADGGQAGVAA